MDYSWPMIDVLHGFPQFPLLGRNPYIFLEQDKVEQQIGAGLACQPRELVAGENKAWEGLTLDSSDLSTLVSLHDQLSFSSTELLGLIQSALKTNLFRFFLSDYKT